MRYSSLRQIALRLAGCHPDDSDWLLAQLAPSQRHRVQVLLKEVAALGLQRDPTLASALLPALDHLNTTESLLPADILLWQQLQVLAHPFWAGMQLLTCDSGQCQRVMATLSGELGTTRSWHEVLGRQDVPEAMLRCLQAFLAIHAAPDPAAETGETP